MTQNGPTQVALKGMAEEDGILLIDRFSKTELFAHARDILWRGAFAEHDRGWIAWDHSDETKNEY